MMWVGLVGGVDGERGTRWVCVLEDFFLPCDILNSCADSNNSYLHMLGILLFLSGAGVGVGGAAQHCADAVDRSGAALPCRAMV